MSISWQASSDRCSNNVAISTRIDLWEPHRCPVLGWTANRILSFPSSTWRKRYPRMRSISTSRRGWTQVPRPPSSAAQCYKAVQFVVTEILRMLLRCRLFFFCDEQDAAWQSLRKNWRRLREVSRSFWDWQVHHGLSVRLHLSNRL